MASKSKNTLTAAKGIGRSMEPCRQVSPLFVVSSFFRWTQVAEMHIAAIIMAWVLPVGCCSTHTMKLRDELLNTNAAHVTSAPALVRPEQVLGTYMGWRDPSMFIMLRLHTEGRGVLVSCSSGTSSKKTVSASGVVWYLDGNTVDVNGLRCGISTAYCREADGKLTAMVIEEQNGGEPSLRYVLVRDDRSLDIQEDCRRRMDKILHATDLNVPVYYTGFTGTNVEHAADGTKISEKSYCDGKPHGLWMKWDHGGNVIEVKSYTNGILELQ